MIDHTKQYEVLSYEDGENIGRERVDDPFVRATVRVRGRRKGWRLLFGGAVKVEILVTGTPEAERVVLQGDYSVFEPSRPTPPPSALVARVSKNDKAAAWAHLGDAPKAEGATAAKPKARKPTTRKPTTRTSTTRQPTSKPRTPKR